MIKSQCYWPYRDDCNLVCDPAPDSFTLAALKQDLSDNINRPAYAEGRNLRVSHVEKELRATILLREGELAPPRDQTLTDYSRQSGKLH